QPNQILRAVPGANTNVPLWILGSSLFGAQLAAALGLPYAFASHFAPEALLPALRTYRERFRPSDQLARPYAMVGINAVVADTGEAARRLFTSAQQRTTNMLRGVREELPPPIDDIDTYWSPLEKLHASARLACSFVGGPDTVRRALERFLAETRADELMVNGAIFEHADRLRSYELLAGLRRPLDSAPGEAENDGAGASP
ncbi:MAG: MsnO8 family LLM class oxidoreductase, partial [Alphaproteobacteria bacterium]|nr:MsnO8 family LLM class oxidoreductase [Alphaproteobacteria bacterium]